jgi:CHAT domain-containing protein
MSLKYRSLIVLVLLPLLALGQSTEHQVQTEAELISALCDASRDQESKKLLLKTNPELVNSSLWRALSDKASAAYYNEPPQQSLAIYEVAIQVATQLRDPKLLGKTYYNQGRTYSGLNQLSKAIQSYEKSREHFQQAGLHRDLIYILSDLGTASFIQENYPKAKDYSEQGLSLAESLRHSNAPPGAWPDAYGVATSLSTLGELAMREGNINEAIERLQNSLALYQQLNSGKSYYDYYVAETYAALGRVYTSAGDHARALSFLHKALTIARQLAQAEQVPNLLTRLGFLYLEQEDYDQATAYFGQSLRTYQTNKNRKESSRVLLNLGVAQQRQSNYDQAVEFFRQSLREAEAVDHKDVMIAAKEGIGVVLTAKGDYEAALEALRSGLVLANQINDQMRQTEILWRQAQAYYALRNYAQAATLSQQALALARTLRLTKLSYLSATTLGESYSALNKSKLAAQTLVQAIDEVELLREMVAGTERQVQNFFEYRLAPYHALIDLLIKQNKPLDALIYAERAKGRVLLDILSSGRSDLAKVLTTAEKAETQRLNRKISEINDRIKMRETADSSSMDSLHRQLDAARLEYQSFEDALYVAHPDFRVRTGRTAALTSTDINYLTMSKDCAYVEYVVSKERIYAFVLTRKRAGAGPVLKVYPLGIQPQDLARKVDQFHQRLANRHPDFASIAHELYAMLIEPASEQLRGISTVCIVPDGFLWNLPFQALITNSNHYLIEDHSLYYAPSLSVLREMTTDKVGREKGDASLLAFGNPVIGTDEQRHEELCPLPEAETEVKTVARTFRALGNKVLIGRVASEKTFRALAPTYATIHLATHGVLDNRQPLYSHLLLTKTAGDLENDGLLEAREIMNMKLNADLAVLSACETANGRISPGEGVMGMSWAFFVAGARSMLVSQWKVNSVSTSQLMKNFYHTMEVNARRSNRNKAAALQAAARNLMKDQRYRHPFYWSAFVLIGSNQ